MIKLGHMQKLEVIKEEEYGLYLKNKKDKSGEKVLLPKKQVPKNTNVGDEIEVFIYKDSKDRLIATTKKPKIMLGEIASLKVVDKTKIGAFMNWGLDRDLFLPFKQQTSQIRVNGEYLVGMYIDKSKRLCATMDIHKVLTTDSPYKADDKVKGTLYSMVRGLGAFVAVDDKYHGLIHEKELRGHHRIGEKIECRVIKVKEDGKLDLSLKEKALKQMDKDAEKIYKKLIKNDGKLPYNDNSSPAKINDEFGMSKSSFKRAIGRLLKAKKIRITSKGIVLLSEDEQKSEQRNRKPSNRKNINRRKR